MRAAVYHISIYLSGFCLLTALHSTAQTSGYSGTGANMDVTYYRCEWRINPDSASKGIKGTVTIYFNTVTDNVTQLSVDLNKTSFNNASLSVSYHGAAATFSFPSSGNQHILRINLPVTLMNNTSDSVTISYNGVPPAVTGQAEGYQKKTSSGYNYIYTLSESFEDKDWWPCKADMQDKPDSMDIYINVPSAFTAVTIGRLMDSAVAGSNQIFHWKTTLPVATYLVAVAVAKYRVYDRGTVNIGGDSVPVWYFIFPGKTAGTYTSILNALDNSMAELTAFSSVFGDYPFKTEKHGYYEFGWGGGMEHQSISAMGAASLTSWGTIAHELAHQWFGDKVTFSTWNHLWLAEGFARYAEALAAEMVPALSQNPVTVRSAFKTTANNSTYRNYSCYIPDSYISSSDVLWSSAYGSTVYERGAMVVSMLRTLLGDSVFFQGCRNYLQDPALAFRSATTADLQYHMEQAAGGYDLTPFFTSWVYGNGYPLYNAGIGWARSGVNRITFQVTTQSKSTGSTVGYYYTPLAIRVQGALAGQDTILVLYDQNGQLSKAGAGIGTAVAGTIISFNLAFEPVTVSFDPFAQTLASGSLTLNSILDLHMGDPVLLTRYPAKILQLTVRGDEVHTAEAWLERSCDGIHFSIVQPMIKKQVNEQEILFEAADNEGCSGRSWYRIKTESPAGPAYSGVLSVAPDNTTQLLVYPNPADHAFYIWRNNGNDPLTVTVTDINGKTILEKQLTGATAEISTTGLSAGMYTVQCKQQGLLIHVSKLIIRHGN